MSAAGRGPASAGAAGGEGRAPVRVARYLGASDGSAGGPRELRLEVAAPCDAQGLLRSMDCSKPVLARAFAGRALLRGDEPLARTDALATGDVVTLRLARGGGDAPAAAHLPAGVAEPRVLYRDAFLMAVDKPAGILVHSDGGGAATLTSWVAAWLAAAGVPATPQAVQRLDVQTTGVTLFSLATEFQPQLDALVAGHAMHKRYLAVVEGALPRDLSRIEAPIGRDRHDARRMRVSASGKPALTLVRTLCRRGGRSLVELELGTGRRHQIRVHLAHLGHPIVGDALYGRARGGGAGPSRPGLMLHAYQEEFTHPVTGEKVSICAGWPHRFDAYFGEEDLGSASRG